MQHKTEVRSNDHYHIALCDCGWIGFPYDKKKDAENDATDHGVAMGDDGYETNVVREREEWEKDA